MFALGTVLFVLAGNVRSVAVILFYWIRSNQTRLPLLLRLNAIIFRFVDRVVCRTIDLRTRGDYSWIHRTRTGRTGGVIVSVTHFGRIRFFKQSCTHQSAGKEIWTVEIFSVALFIEDKLQKCWKWTKMNATVFFQLNTTLNNV